MPPRGALLFVSALLGALCVAPARRDIDVGVPPGSPLEWSASFPAYTPPEAPLFPLTGSATAPPDPQRTLAKPVAVEADVRFANAFGQVRILTWDLGAHLPWTTQPPPAATRTDLRAAPPSYGEPLWWLSMAPLLRLLLHPDALSRAETLAHLVELGAPALPVLSAAAVEADLAPACLELRALIALDTAPLPTAPGGATPRESSLARFVLEECLRDQPYDPSDDFGRRLFLFADEAEPWLRMYAQHPALDLARNAVAALGRYPTRRAVEFLCALAGRVEDPVTLVRALAAVGRYRGALDVRPLLERLRKTNEPVQRAALIGALGRLGAREAGPLLLELGEQARRAHDSDLLISVLSALARIAWPGTELGLTKLCQRVEDEARELAVPSNGTLKADVPDAPSLRATILEHLAKLARTQTDPLDARARAALLTLAKAGPLDARLSELGVGGTDPLASLAPPVRLLYLEGLQRAGPAGLEELAALVQRAELEPVLRGRALTLLQGERRAALACTLLAAPTEPVELRVQALELLIADRHPRAIEQCRAQLSHPALAQARPAAGELFLTLRAVRYLSAAGKLAAKELLPLFPFVQRPTAQREADVNELRERVLELVNAARDGERRPALEKRAGQLFDLVVAKQLNALLDPHMRDTRCGLLLQALEPARDGDAPPEIAAQLAPALLSILLGGEVEVDDPGRALFRPSVPLAEELVLALGRTQEPLAIELVLSVLRGGARELRAHAALALGMCAQPALAKELLALLLDPDPFVRFCASESLRHLLGKELAVDWMYAPAAERSAAAEEFQRWYVNERR